MSIESYLMELVCSTRWVCNLLLSSGSEHGNTWAQRYPGDAEAAKQALFMLSKTHSHVEDMEEIPEAIVSTLCEGALYLLASELILGHCPPTMHTFLQQTTLQRQQSAAQAQLLLLRWLLTAEILQIDNVMGTIFEDAVALEDYATDYDAHLAIARYFAQTEPFYLGAHVMILRGLLLHFINDSLQGEDVVNHLQLIAPDIVAGNSIGGGSSASGALMIEDALLSWIRGVLSLFTAELNSAAARRIVQEICHVDDLYLHTNDGRVIALVIHHYQPSLVDLNLVHFTTPLSMWQRQDNWTHIIRAAEALGVWVGVFADEMVAHGFVTLQQHLLRIVQDLFLVLACDAEERYETLRKTIEAHAAPPAVAGPDTSIGSDRELEGHTTYVDKDVMHSMMITSSTPPPMLSRPPAVYETVGDNGDHPFDGQQHRDTIHSRETIETNSSTPPFPTSRDGPAALPHDDVEEDEGDVEQVDVSQQHGDFNIVMTGLFLQGVSIPLRRQAQPADEVQQLSAAVAQADHSARHSVVVPSSSTPLSQPKQLEMLQGSASSAALQPLEVLTEAHAGAGDQPPRSDSPVLVGRSAEFRRMKLREDNAVASSVAHFKHLRSPARAATTSTHNARPQLRQSMVQGSMDVEGIESLLQELATIANDQAVRPKVVGGAAGSDMPADPLAEAREQNHALRWALEEQRRKVAAMVDKLRSGIRKQEFSAIVRHLKGHKGAPTAAGANNQQNPVLSLGGVRRSLVAGGGAAANISFASQQRYEGGEASAKREETFRQSIEHLRGSTQRSGVAQRVVVSGGASHAISDPPAPPQQAALPSSVPHLPSVAVGKSNRGGVALNFSTGGINKKVMKAALSAGAPEQTTSDDNDKSAAPLQLVPLETVRNARKLSLASQQQRAKRSNSSTSAVSGAEDAAMDDGGASTLGSTIGTASAAITTAAPVVIKTRNNKAVMVLAFKHVLLTGQLNKAALEKVLGLVSDLTEEGGHQFIVLFKDEFTQQFKGLYTIRPDGVLVRVYGSGPYMAYAGPQPTSETEATVWAQGLPYLFPKFFKFDSGSKTFQMFSAKWVNQAADGVAFAAAKPKLNDRERF